MQSQFTIRNERSQQLALNIEPEGAMLFLHKGEEVTVTDTFTSQPLTLKLNDSDGGSPIISVWPGDGDVLVEKDGMNVLDLLVDEKVHA